MTATKPEPRTRRRTGWWLIDFYRSDVGKKWAMAVTGIALLGFVLFHLAGNLKVYIGADEINEYGESLRDLGGHLVPRTHLLWIFRLGLILAFAVHIHAAFVLTARNRKARPVGYESPRDYIVANYASRTMIWSGIIVLLFILFHLADLTWGTTNPDFFRGDINSNLIASFERWPVALFYVVANLALGLHIYHGAWSLFQSIGASSPRFNDWRRWFAVAFALVIVIGNLSFPIAVQIGVID